ncbi:hypothetical protein [Desulforhabdus amnigena]|jgi:predicted transposase YdaD|uniref:Uncharacterized protein n=1 Tax=Desulforhabdus amnigena TaxID=40218 RepID=A0A9W6FVR2_9BACT|nr:hypothetical protein [Desulforhabdus amnigena]NLJ27035.1 hypothetical protein [Deltaproteobacteria bacterium]GLI35785.1 hypothetical protein DAMNIGENAA_32180 [Desulforhabdus amnigena]
MESQKLELIQKLEEKGMSITQAAEAMEFDAELLNLYFARDAYPVPKRILEKLAEIVKN